MSDTDKGDLQILEILLKIQSLTDAERAKLFKKIKEGSWCLECGTTETCICKYGDPAYDE